MFSTRRQTHRRRMMRGISVVLAAAIVPALNGCATMRMHMRYGALLSDTKVSESVFLEPRTALPQTVHLVETASANVEISVRPQLDRNLTAMGYTVVEDPDSATYVMQINHRQLIETELSGDQTLGDALSGALTAGFATGIAVDVLGGAGDVAAGVGVAVGAIGFLVDANTKHIAHVLTTDVRVTEAVPAQDPMVTAYATHAPVAALALDRRYHDTQIASGASKVNLKLGEALPVIVERVTETLAGLLPAHRPTPS